MDITPVEPPIYLYQHEPLVDYGVGTKVYKFYSVDERKVLSCTFPNLLQEFIALGRVDGVHCESSYSTLRDITVTTVLQRLTDIVEEGGENPYGELLGNLFGLATIEGIQYYVVSYQYLYELSLLT